MDVNDLTAQFIGFHKSIFDNTFKSIKIFQTHTKEAVEAMLADAGRLTGQDVTVVSNWMDLVQNGCDTVKSAVDDQFRQVESFFADANKVDTSASSTPS